MNFLLYYFWFSRPIFDDEMDKIRKKMASVQRLDWDEDQIAHVKSMHKYFRSKRDKHHLKFRWHLKQWQIHDTNMHIMAAAQARIAAVQAQKQWQLHDANMHICEHILRNEELLCLNPT